jgi:hypothetical protein
MADLFPSACAALGINACRVGIFRVRGIAGMFIAGMFVNGKLVYADRNLFQVEGARKFPDARCSEKLRVTGSAGSEMMRRPTTCFGV